MSQPPVAERGKDLARGPNSIILAMLGMKPLTFRSVIKVKQRLDVAVEEHGRNRSSFLEIWMLSLDILLIF